ncbi:MAG: protein kinase [Acidobacteriota bacterium]
MSSVPPTPEKLGSYRLESLLGRGGMGEVFLAWDERLERHVAVKRILPDPPPNEQARMRFRREARAAARLSHPAIVQVFELLEVEDGDCLVMEYVEGRSLVEFVALGPMELETTLRLGAEIADGLSAAHAKGLIHRDLKPENVRVTDSDGRAKILDFGLARLLWNEAMEGDSLAEALTRSGALVGTVHAMSPEQASGRTVDHRADLFALGGVLYSMLTGRAAFRGSNVLDTLHRVTSEEPPPLAELRPGLPGELIELVEGMLAKEPARRPQNARLVVDALEAIRSALSDATPTAATSTLPVSSPLPAPAFDSDDAEAPTGEIPDPRRAAAIETVVRTLLLTDLVGSTCLVESLGDQRAAEVSARHDRVARDLLVRHGGLEIDKTDGFLFLFERPVAAVTYALAYHQSLADLTAELGVKLAARTGLHLGEVVLRENSPEDVSRGAKPLEVEGLAKPMAARIMSLAGGRQTLLTQSVFDLTRRAAVGDGRWDEELHWLAHGGYLFQGVEEPVEVYEVGVKDFAPLAAPPDSPKVRRAVSVSAELMLGWRPASGQAIPRRPNWLLEERLGEGGFGEVWLARHESGEKRVFKFCFEASRLRALKREVTLFRLLKGALGHRDDIARVLDWNFDAAPFFLEAEHTEGGDLATWAEQQGGLAAIPLATRVELVAQVADALAAAHSVGVLHKDVKPENILVTQGVDGRPRVRLTDFGVAALADRSHLESQEIPALGFTVTLTEEDSTAGSRRYLAPELLEGKPASVQGDLYSLGVLLYQMAVADFSRALAPGWQREVEDELLAEDVALLVDGSPQRRPSGADPVAQRLRALEARRAERRDTRRAARRRKQLRFASAVGAVLLVMASGLLVQAHFARRQAEQLQARAENAREQAEGLIGFMLGDLQEKLQAIGRLDALEGAGKKALEYFEGLEASDRTAETVARQAKALHQMGDVKMAQGDLDAALALFERSLAQTRELVERNPEDTDALFKLGQSHFWVGNVHWRRSDLENALQQFQAYLSASLRLHQNQPETPEWLLEVSFGHTNVGEAFLQRGNSGLAFEHFQRALEPLQKLVALESSKPSSRRRLADAHLRLGYLHYRHGRPKEALSQGLNGCEILRTLVAESPSNVNLQRQLATAHDFMASLQLFFGHLEAALSHSQSNLAIWEKLTSIDTQNIEWQELLSIAQVLNSELLGYMNRRHEADSYLQKALAKSGEADDDPRRLLVRSQALSLMARQQTVLGNKERSIAAARRAVRLIQPIAEGSDTPRFLRQWVDSQLALGWALGGAASEHEASSAFRSVRSIMDSRFSERSPKDDWRLLNAHLGLGEIEQARALAYTLLGMGLQHPEFLAKRDALGI